MKAATRALNEDNLEAFRTAIENLEDVNALSHGKSLLYLAAEKNSQPFCEALLEKGADPNKLTDTGMAPIHIVAPETDLFKLFMGHGGDYSLPDAHQKEPIFYAVDCNNQELVHFLLEKDGTVATRCNDKRTPLHDCAERGFIDIASDLLDHGADVNAQNWNNVTPLHLAACYGRFDMLELLVDRGAALDAQDDDGRTALHYAAMHNHGDMCMYLVSMGCDHTLRDKEGRKGAEVAPMPLKNELIDYIINHLMQRSRGIQLSSSNVGICVFCQKAEAEFVFKPCEHVSLCKQCYDDNKEALHFCPMCRKTLTSVETIGRETE